MNLKHLVGRSCEFQGKSWRIICVTTNMLGTYVGLKRDGLRAVASLGAIYLGDV